MILNKALCFAAAGLLASTTASLATPYQVGVSPVLTFLQTTQNPVRILAVAAKFECSAMTVYLEQDDGEIDLSTTVASTEIQPVMIYLSKSAHLDVGSITDSAEMLLGFPGALVDNAVSRAMSKYGLAANGDSFDQLTNPLQAALATDIGTTELSVADIMLTLKSTDQPVNGVSDVDNPMIVAYLKPSPQGDATPDDVRISMAALDQFIPGTLIESQGHTLFVVA